MLALFVACCFPFGDLLPVVFGPYLIEYFFDHAVAVNDEGCTQDARRGTPHEFLFSPGAECFRQAMVRIRQQREIQVVFVSEFTVRNGCVGAYTDHIEPHLPQLLPAVAQAACFERTAGRIVFGVKIQNDTPAFQGVGGDGIAVLVRDRESRYPIACLELCHNGKSYRYFV